MADQKELKQITKAMVTPTMSVTCIKGEYTATVFDPNNEMAYFQVETSRKQVFTTRNLNTMAKVAADIGCQEMVLQVNGLRLF